MYLGIDIGGTGIKAGIIDDTGILIFKDQIPTRHNKGIENDISQLVSFIDNILAKMESIKTIGVGMPGVIDFSGNIIVSPNLPEWENLSLYDIIGNRSNLPFAFDNDANAAAIAEQYYGAGKDLNSFIYVTLGTGVGGAIINQNKLFKGANGAAGEIGHTIIHSSVESDSSNYRAGTLESLVGKIGIINLYEEIYKRSNQNIQKIESFDVENISKAAENGEIEAIECLRTAGFYLGIGLASAMNLLGVDKAIIGGGISKIHNIFYDSAINTLKRRALPSIAMNAEILKATFMEDTGIIGAACLGKNLIN